MKRKVELGPKVGEDKEVSKAKSVPVSADADDLYKDDPEEEDLEGKEEDKDEDLEDEEEELPKGPWYTNKAVIIGIVVGLVLIVVLVFFFMSRGSTENKTPELETYTGDEATTEEVVVDPAQQQADRLYQLGIGKESINQKNIFDQGPIESNSFRKDFLNTDAKENYTEPIEIVNVKDSVSYVKHRTITDEGMDMYWVDAQYKGKKTQFTIPYSVYQSLAPEGVMDVTVETVTDDEGKVYVTGFNALPLEEDSGF